MKPFWRRPMRELAADALRAVAQRFAPAPPPPQQTLFPDDPRRLVERTLETPPGGPFDGFRSVSWTQRDLNPLNHDLMLAGAQWLWAASPIGKRAIEIHQTACVSAGWEPKATCADEQERADVQEVLEDFWHDETFDWRVELGSLFRELALSGELSLHHNDNPWDGRVHVGLISPEHVAQIDPDPLNASKLIKLQLKQEVQTGWNDDGQPHMQQIFRINHRERAGRPLEGEVFHCRVNGLANASRGLSDLMPVIDWLDQMHQLVHSEVDRAFLTKAFNHDVTIVEGSDKDVKDAKKRNIEPPQPGSVNFHTDKEIWKINAPELQHADFLELVKFIQGWICACLGVPEHWLYEANTVNKASAGEMDDPVWARIRDRQGTMKAFIGGIFRYVLERAYLCRRTLKDGRTFTVAPGRATFEVHATDPDRKNYPEASTALATLTVGAVQAETAGYMTHLEAANFWRRMANQTLGTEFDDFTESNVPPAKGIPALGAGPTPALPDADRSASINRMFGTPSSTPRPSAGQFADRMKALPKAS